MRSLPRIADLPRIERYCLSALAVEDVERRPDDCTARLHDESVPISIALLDRLLRARGCAIDRAPAERGSV